MDIEHPRDVDPSITGQPHQVTGEVPDPGSTRGVERRAMKLIEALARRAGDPGRAYNTPTAV